ncbi:MAG: flagellar motor protein MotD [Stagnimonas sp.]|nr:flagellar motor protein MotD [Stagnimonas sp.]
MARKHKHEEHLNAEAWAIPYGDLVTLLLALFVVMYAMSSVNEGKYRVMSEAMSEAFHGTPRTLRPVQVGDKNERGLGSSARVDLTHQPPKQVSIGGLHRDLKNPQVVAGEIKTALPSPQQMPTGASGYRDGGKQSLKRIAREVEHAMQGLIQQNLIVVRRKATYLEIEIKTDILFASGVANVSTLARPVLLRLGEILKPFDNPLRVEGHTDNMPIATASYPSNWELSSARAASVVHVLLDAAVSPKRLSVGGFGEYQPVADNTTQQGRNANRRVVIVVLAGEGEDGTSMEKVLGAQLDDGEAEHELEQVAQIEPPQAPLQWPLGSDATVRLAP